MTKRNFQKMEYDMEHRQKDNNGLRTEKIMLEITHCCMYPVAEWVLELIQDTCSDPGESVRVVSEWDQIRESCDRVSREEGIKTLTEEVEALNKEIDRLTDERDAAIREREETKEETSLLLQAIGLATTAVPSMEVNVDDPIGMMRCVVARVAQLEAEQQTLLESEMWGVNCKPSARGWLTEEERRDLWEIASLLEDSGWQKCADALLAILARLTPKVKEVGNE